MLAVPKDVPVINHPVFRIVLGAVLIAAGVAVRHDSIVFIAAGALLLVMGVARGYGLAHRTQKAMVQ